MWCRWRISEHFSSGHSINWCPTVALLGGCYPPSVSDANGTRGINDHRRKRQQRLRDCGRECTGWAFVARSQCALYVIMPHVMEIIPGINNFNRAKWCSSVVPLSIYIFSIKIVLRIAIICTTPNRAIAWAIHWKLSYLLNSAIPQRKRFFDHMTRTQTVFVDFNIPNFMYSFMTISVSRPETSVSRNDLHDVKSLTNVLCSSRFLLLLTSEKTASSIYLIMDQLDQRFSILQFLIENDTTFHIVSEKHFDYDLLESFTTSQFVS